MEFHQRKIVMEYEIKPSERFKLGLREIWQYRELFYFFTWRDIRVKYKQTMLGFAWAFLQPLAFMLVFTLVFRRNISDLAIPYPLFAFTGLIIWNVFAGGISGAANSMVTNAHIIKKIYFPRLIIPVSSVFVALFDFIMTLPLLIGLMVWYNVEPQWSNIWMVVPAILLAVLAAAGPGCFLAALNVKYRDFRYVIPFLVQLLLFVTPVIYPANYFTTPWIQKILALNPMSAPVTMFRSFITGETLNSDLLLISISSAIVCMCAGLFVFRKTEKYFADLA
jgi:lipopolysaccharide transport system permease protein